jgi:hypothetical protein
MVTNINSLKVINDSAERGIALMTEYNTTVSKGEEEVQAVLQEVSVHRKKLPPPIGYCEQLSEHQQNERLIS